MGIAPLDSPAIRFEAAFEAAGRKSGASAAFAAELDALAVDLDGARPKEAALIGLDRPVTLHVAPLFSPFDAGLTRLLEVIRARPWERHLVLLTGQGPRVAELQDRIADAGGAALAADQYRAATGTGAGLTGAGSVRQFCAALLRSRSSGRRWPCPGWPRGRTR